MVHHFENTLSLSKSFEPRPIIVARYFLGILYSMNTIISLRSATLTILALILLIVGAYTLHYAYKNEILITNSGNQSLAETPLSQEKQVSLKLPLLTFISPKELENVSGKDRVKLEWQLTDPTLLQIFQNENTFIHFNIIDINGTSVGKIAIGGGPRISEREAIWDLVGNLNQEFYTLNKEGGQYKLRASLSYEPKGISCNPEVKGECDPIYSTQDQALMEKAKNYESESGWFTIDMDQYIRPTALFDSSSLKLSSSNATIRGTSNLSVLKINISNYDNAGYLVQTTVPVVDGKWSYTPNLPNGKYSLQLWDESGSLPLPSAVFLVEDSNQ